MERASERSRAGTNGQDQTGAAAALTLRLDYRAPYDWEHIIGFLRLRAIPGVEHVADNAYRRVVHIDGNVGTITVRPWPARSALQLAVSSTLVPVLMPLVARVRRLFDLDARPDAIGSVLARDPLLRPLVRLRPGLRVPGAIDPYEASVRALLGQQVSVAAATTMAGRFAAAFGTPLATSTDGTLAVRFPTAAEIAARSRAQIAAIGLPFTRASALFTFASAVATGAIRIDGVLDLDAFVADLVALPGIGPWTAHYLAMRALHTPDAFPAADLHVRKALGGTPRDAEARAEIWRPFRSYAVMYLWSTLGGTDADNDDDAISARPIAPVRARRGAGGRVHARAGGARRGSRSIDARPRRRGGATRRVLRG